MATGLPLLTYGLAEIGVDRQLHRRRRSSCPCLAGLALIATFVVHALRVPRPLLDLRLYRRPTFASASFAMFCLGGALFGSMILLPLYWQEIRHQSVVDTGLLTAPQGLGMALVMPLAGKLTDRWGGGPLALFGVVVTTHRHDPVRADRRPHARSSACRWRCSCGAWGSASPSCPRWPRPSRRSSARSSPTPRRSSTSCSASADRSGPRCSRSCSSARWSACTRSKAPPQAYGTAFWVAGGLTAAGDRALHHPAARRAGRA